MWMTEYIRECQRKLVTQYGFTPDLNGLPQNVPDGNYPMEINGRLDNVTVKDGRLHVCRFEEKPPSDKP